MWALIDNYDSFTHILHHYLLESGADCRVLRNDELSIEKLTALAPSRIILSPGPGRPEGAGITMAAIAHFHTRIPMLGICLGHQALGVFFGMELDHSLAPMHGKTSIIQHTGVPIFSGIPERTKVMRYHSLSLKPLPTAPVRIIATTVVDNTIMAIQHNDYPIIGLQFHPESIGTPQGKILIRNWAEMY